MRKSAPLRLGPLLLAATAASAAPPAERGVSFLTGDPAAALRYFETRVARSSADVSAFLDAAVLYRDLGRPEKALPYFDAAANLRPDDPEIHAALGWAALRSGSPERAGEAFARSLRLRPAQPQALLGRARLRLDSANAARALEDLRALNETAPEFTLGYLYAGRAWAQRGDWARAVEAYRQAYRSDPTYSEVRFLMGPLYMRLGSFNQAWRQYAKVLDLEPANRTALREKSRLARLITRKPSQIIPPRRLPRPFKILPSPESPAMPWLRVGIGTTSRGTPAPKKALIFSCDGPFRVFDPRNGRRLWAGPASQIFLLRKAKGRRGGFELVDSRQRRRLFFRSAVAVRPERTRSHSLLFKRLDLASGTAWASSGDRQFKGIVEARPSGGGLVLVNALGLEDYLYGVVNGEMPADFPPQALRAQAVIARNHALYTQTVLKPHRRDGYDLCDGQHCQVYTGIAGETPAGREAVDATRARVLRWGRRLAQTPYSANCGGRTQDSGEVRGWGELPYLRGSPDSEIGDAPRTPWDLDRWLKTAPRAFCNVPKHMQPSDFRWSRIVDAAGLEARLNRRTRFGRLKDLRVLRRSAAGNVRLLAFTGTLGTLRLDKENDIRKIMGLAAVRSTLFIIEMERGRDGFPKELYLYGGGWGHGVGLCQCGAAGRALAGQTAETVLAHYFPGTTLSAPGY